MLPQLLNDDNTHVTCRALLQVLCRGRKEKKTVLFFDLLCKQAVSEQEHLFELYMALSKHFDGYCACIMPAISKGYSCVYVV